MNHRYSCNVLGQWWISTNLRMRTYFAFLIFVSLLSGQTENRFQPGIRPFVTVDDAQIALQHVRVIDGTGAPAAENQTILIDPAKSQRSDLPQPFQFPTVRASWI